jgi:hypothetical protein
MERLVFSEIVKNGVMLKNILVEKAPSKGSRFKPDITVSDNGTLTFFECHYHDGWGKGIPSHIYNNIDIVKKQGKVIICLEKNRKKKIEKYIQGNKILSKANEVWFLDLESDKIQKFINC